MRGYPGPLADVRVVRVRGRRYFLLFVDAPLAAYLCERAGHRLLDGLVGLRRVGGRYVLTAPPVGPRTATPTASSDGDVVVVVEPSGSLSA